MVGEPKKVRKWWAELQERGIKRNKHREGLKYTHNKLTNRRDSMRDCSNK